LAHKWASQHPNTLRCWVGPMTAFRPKHLSVSSIALYVRCPALFKQRYVEKMVPPTNPPMSFGIAFHAALEAEHRGEDSERALIAEWNKRQDILTAANLGTMPPKTHALALLDEYKRLGLGGVVGHAEKKFVLPFPNPSIPVPLLGYIDLVLPDEIREFKTTGATTWTEAKAAMAAQTAAYGWAVQRIYRRRLPIRYVIFRTDILLVHDFVVHPSPDGFRAFEAEAEAVWAGIVKGEYPPCGTCELCKPPAARSDNGPVVTFDE
jgi:hypothetical protein